MDAEIDVYLRQLQRVLDRVCRCLEGLGEAELNWRPPAPETNSLYVIATHVMGNAEAWVLGIICGQPVHRDRDAEFRATGADSLALTSRARRLSDEFASALRGLPPSALDEKRQPRPPLLGIGPADELTVREALMRVLVHALMHIGQMQITRDLAIAAHQQE
jgi:hypothetical protein